MDDFSAQSRDDNDLFSDDFEPAPEPPTTYNAAVTDTKPTSILSNPQVSQPPPRGNFNQRGGRGTRGGPDRRRGGRGGPVQSGGLASSRYADSAPAKQSTAAPKETSPSSADAQVKPTEKPTENSPQPQVEAIISSETAHDTKPAPSTQTSTKPTENAPARPHAVRGDRSATGGPAHKKLTEEEMTAKLEKMKIMDAQRAERFRKSEADQAAFQQKEAELAKRREDELKNRRAMDMERAKNRERKLRSQGGREWDESKTEADIVDGRGGRSSEYVRGGHGGVINGRGGGLAGSSYSLGGFVEVHHASEGGRGRGNDGRGRGGRGGRGRGSGVENRNNQKTDLAVKPGDSAPTDFPPLPAPSKAAAESTKSTRGSVPTALTSMALPTDGKPVEWAEEMATPVEKPA